MFSRNMALGERRMPMPFIGASYSMCLSPISTITCATTASCGSEHRGGRFLPPTTSIPYPPILKARVLTTNIDLDEGTCSLDLLEAASGFFALTLAQARSVIKEVATVTATWRDTAKAVGAHATEISRMASAFEHDDLRRALAL